MTSPDILNNRADAEDEKPRLYEGAVNRPWGLSRYGAGVSKHAGNTYQF